MSHIVCLSLGSNISPEIHLPAAVDRLRSIGRLLSVSRVWQSVPVGDLRQADFCNAAVALTTDCSAVDLVAADGPLRRIESELGRVRDPGNRNAARTIDIDLSLYDDQRLRIGQKELPDPDLWRRAFVAVPLSELPEARLPPDVVEPLSAIAVALSRRQQLIWRTDIVLPTAGVPARPRRNGDLS